MSEVPKDLGIKIGTKVEQFWLQQKEQWEKDMQAGKANLEVWELCLKLANKKIAEEKEKFK